MRIIIILIISQIYLSLAGQTSSFKLDWIPDKIYIKNDSLYLKHNTEYFIFNGQKIVPNTNLEKQKLCDFGDISVSPDHSIPHNGYTYNATQNSLYISCESPSLIREFPSSIVALLKDSNEQLIVATQDHGFYVLKNEQFVTLYLPGMYSTNNINSAVILEDRLLYSTSNTINYWSPDDFIVRTIYTGNNIRLLISADKYKQIWLSDGYWLTKINDFQSIKNLKLSLENRNQNDDPPLLTIQHEGPQLLNDLEYTYRINDGQWVQLGRNRLIYLDSSELERNISIQANSTKSQTDVFNFSIRGKKNNSFESYFWYTIAFLGLLTSVLIVLLWKQISEKKITDQRIEKLRVQKSLRKTSSKLYELQMNPHFIFNCLNAIKGLVAKGENQKARKSIDHFSSIMRSVLNYSRNESNTINEELRFLEKYIALEQLAHPEKFECEITVEESIPKTTVLPPMMIQPFIENAIKHGLLPKPSKGYLQVSLYVHTGILYCQVKDNGVGRQNSSPNTHISQATQIIKDRISNFGWDQQLQIKDLVDSSGAAIGTCVTIPLIKA